MELPAGTELPAEGAWSVTVAPSPEVRQVRPSLDRAAWASVRDMPVSRGMVTPEAVVLAEPDFS